MSALLELAERCEAATGPDRELDMDIRQALNLHNRVSLAKFNVTASVNAALTLVPEGYRWTWDGALKDAIVVKNGDLPTSRSSAFGIGHAATPALAICAAALRARAA